jgi:hypothetical protein
MSGGNSGVESLPSKQMVAGSNPVPRSIARGKVGGCWFRGMVGASAAFAAKS